ncbi:MAG TPA: hypothetical protein VFN25_05435 [Dokdonella sp.]|uniref:hypothetical protein n=1 Tax=Dokdonella sp. TaxID=2291710 RepID=UPI002D7FD7C4|nr:hypothetical protein [Dokdonella sp.]HET9032333.1 hypothetical protein [Dokdonella sp.]
MRPGTQKCSAVEVRPARALVPAIVVVLVALVLASMSQSLPAKVSVDAAIEQLQAMRVAQDTSADAEAALQRLERRLPANPPYP